MTSRPFVFLVLVAFCCSFSACSRTPADMSGAGSTFAAPLYKEWIKKYREHKPDAFIEYAAVGSGKGESQFINGGVDFGATDAAATSDRFSNVERGAIVLPVAAGSIVIAYNSEGLPDGLQLPRDVYVDIFLGKIGRWNDSRIAVANPGVTLPDIAIHRIVRLDSSGTTFAFTSHLSAISETWRDGPGLGKLISWPGPTANAGGNDAVAGSISRTIGAIGYVEFGSARVAGLRTARLENRSGTFVKPSDESASIAISLAETDADLGTLQDPVGKDAYPIVTMTWMLLYKRYDDLKKADLVKDFAKWCVSEGQKYNQSLGYVSLSPALTSSALQKIDAIEK